MIKRELFKVEGDRIVRLRKNCPKCGDGVFLAEHKDRLSCGQCGYTEFKGREPKQKPQLKEEESKAEPGQPSSEVEASESTESPSPPAES